GTRVAGAPVQELQRGIVRTGQPRGPSAASPTVAGPRIIAGLTGSRHGPESPQSAAGSGVVRVEEAAHAGLAPADADDDLVVDHEWRGSDGMADRVVGDMRRPALDAGVRIERD